MNGRQGKIKTVLLVYLVSVCSFALEVRAWECVPGCSPSACEACEEGVCVYRCNSANCQTCWEGSCRGCDPDLECSTCQNGTCQDDASKCTGECHNGCSGGSCVDDDTKCNSCQECSGGVCVLKPTSNCDEDADCPSGKICENCHCCAPLGATCGFLVTCCSGHCNITTSRCEECELDSECGECERCSSMGYCYTILPCPPYTHCDAHNCAPDCVENGPLCNYTNPGTSDGCGHAVDSFQCLHAGGPCRWILVEGPSLEAACVVPDCTTFPTYCAKVRPRLCYDKFVPTMGWTCPCDEGAAMGPIVERGTRQKCPEL
jgi:hypothetical protein